MNSILPPPTSKSQSMELAELVERLTARVKAGEPIDLAEMMEEYPAHADELRQLLPAMKMLAELSGTPDASANLANVGHLTLAEPLGDFQIIREVGRGGMGVVYEATQLSLNRRVALKVLPFAATMDPRHLQRFKNEAMAAASLRHENIVHVYGVGCERSVHFYAMELIEGQSLAQVIAANHHQPDSQEQTSAYQPASAAAPTAPAGALSTEFSGIKGRKLYRSAARIIADAADALEHAHTLGIVHRDIKPANMMVDAEGKIFVTDFGLARLGADAGLTMSGDLLGTLKYMSPEQAMARHGLVDYRTDIYSLGATLYELLTGRPAVMGEDKQELLKHIAFEEPIPLRKIDNSIPVELETITLKTLAKNPAERYAAAKELAEDLRRWMDDKAIKAKPPNLTMQFVKWARRRKSTLWAAGVTSVTALVMAVIGLTISNYLIARERNDKTQALQEKGRALALANANYKKAVNERLRAERSFHYARVAVNSMAGLMGSDHAQEWDKVPEVLRKKLVTSALKFYEKFVKEGHTDAAMRCEMARALESIAVLQIQKLNNRTEAERLFRQSVALLEALVAEYPQNSEYRRVLGYHLLELGLFCRNANPQEAERFLRLSVEHYEQLQLHGGFLAEWSAAKGRLVEFLVKTDQLQVAQGLVTQSLNVVERSNPAPLSQECKVALAQVLINYGVACYHSLHRPEAEAALRNAIEFNPQSAKAHLWLGNVLVDDLLAQEVEFFYRRAIELDPTLSLAYYGLGLRLEIAEKYGDAKAAYQRGHDEATKTVGNLKAVMTYKHVAHAERLLSVSANLTALLSGSLRPSNRNESVVLAVISQHQGQYAAATRHYQGAFAFDQPTNPVDLLLLDDAACVAALAAGGKGRDAANLSDKERADLRQLVLLWCSNHLAHRIKSASNHQGSVVALISTLSRWQKDSDFVSVRESTELAKLPESERVAWEKFWAEVDATIKRHQGISTQVTEPLAD